MVKRNALAALSHTLTLNDGKSLIVAMEGIDNILKTGQQHYINADGINEFVLELEKCGGIDKIEEL